MKDLWWLGEKVLVPPCETRGVSYRVYPNLSQARKCATPRLTVNDSKSLGFEIYLANETKE